MLKNVEFCLFLMNFVESCLFLSNNVEWWLFCWIILNFVKFCRLMSNFVEKCCGPLLGGGGLYRLLAQVYPCETLYQWSNNKNLHWSLMCQVQYPLKRKKIDVMHLRNPIYLTHKQTNRSFKVSLYDNSN